MPIKSLMIAGCLAVAAVGAVSGQAIGSTPMLRAETVDYLPSSSVTSGEFRSNGNVDRPPDHYPLVTPEGTIPVGELALHGRLRHRSGGWYGEEDVIILDANYPEDFSAQQLDRMAQAEPFPEPQAKQVASPPLPLDEPVELADETGAKVVDIAKALSAEDSL